MSSYWLLFSLLLQINHQPTESYTLIEAMKVLGEISQPVLLDVVRCVLSASSTGSSSCSISMPIASTDALSLSVASVYFLLVFSSIFYLIVNMHFIFLNKPFQRNILKLSSIPLFSM